MRKGITRRLFSVPGIRWRGRIKQFERQVYDNWAKDIDRSIWASWCDRWVESFSGEIPEGSAILDVGCGTGRALLILSMRRPALLAGFDISPKAIDVAGNRLHGHTADLRVGDAEAGLPWPDGTFDAVTMTATIHHLPNPRKVIDHVFRVLKPDGRLIIAEPFFFFPLLQIENLLVRIYPLNGDLRFFSQRGLRRLVEHGGFQVVAQKRAAFLARYTLAQR
jgi:ubiquinone/menaquinone biosynthesis C-methylase UbiE